MTMAINSRLSSVPQDVQRIMTATLELREAKEMLRRGNVIKGVQRYETAKKALHRAVNSMSDAGITRQENLAKTLSEQVQVNKLLQAAVAFKNALEAYRASGSDSRAALALVQAEKQLISELDHVERHHN